MEQYKIDDLLDRYGQALIDFNARVGMQTNPVSVLRHANEVVLIRKEIETALLDKPHNLGPRTSMVRITFPADRKILTIKGIREALGWGLKESKDAVETGAISGLTRAEAFYVKNRVETSAAGALVEVTYGY